MQKSNSIVIVLLVVVLAGVGWIFLGSGAASTQVVNANEADGQGQSIAHTGPALGSTEEDPDSSDSDRTEIEHQQPIVAAVSSSAIAPDSARIKGRTVDVDGRPLARAKLEIWATHRTFNPTLFTPEEALAEGLIAHAETQSDGAGRFTFDELPGQATHLYLRASAPGLADTDLFDFEPDNGRQRDLGDITIGAFMAIQGMVVNAEQQPIAGAQLFISKSGSLSTRVNSTASEAGFADSQGRFIIDGLGPGSFVVGAVATDYAMAFTDEVTLVPGELPPSDQTLRLEPGYILRGRVMGSGQPLLGAEVRLTQRRVDNAQPLVILTDESGRFEFPGLGTDGQIRISVKAPDYLPLSYTFRASGDTAGMIEEVIELYPQRSLTITVLDDASSAPIEGVQIFPTGTAPSGLANAARAGFAIAPGITPLGITDQAGQLVLPLSRNTISLLAHGDGYANQVIGRPPYASTSKSGNQKAMDEVLEIRMLPGCQLAITVTSAGAPVAGANIELRLNNAEPGPDPNNPAPQKRNNSFRFRNRSYIPTKNLLWKSDSGVTPVATTTTDAAGLAHFDALPPGLYYVACTPADPSLESALDGPIKIFASSREVEFEVLLEPAGSIFGQVSFRGSPAAGQLVTAVRSLSDTPVTMDKLLPKLYERLSTTTDDEGFYRFENLTPGSWKCAALLPPMLAKTASPIHSNAAIGYQLRTNAKLVELASGAEVQTDLTGQSPGARISGRMLVNHEARPGIRIRGHLRDADGNRMSFSALSDANGRYETSGVLPGNWAITASMKPAETKANRRFWVQDITVVQQDLNVPDQPEVTLDLNAQVGGLVLTLDIRDPETPEGEEPIEVEPLSWLSIRLQADAERGGVPGTTAKDLTSAWFDVSKPFSLDGLPVGSYKIVHDYVPEGAAPATFEISAGGTTKVTLEVVREPVTERDEESSILNGMGYL